jgi:hypothetical protein
LKHAPQCSVDVFVSTQAASQTVVPVTKQVHAPAWQRCPAPHPLKQSPQCSASVWRSTHREPHAVMPSRPHTHRPPWQDVAPVQNRPHWPQLASSDLRSTHDDPQAISQAFGQWHAPFAQRAPGGQDRSPPQCARSGTAGAQRVPSSMNPEGHVHVP